MSFKLDFESPVPLHSQVEAYLRGLIALKEYKDGKFLPKEVMLSKKLGVSRNTIRQAINKLVNEGLIVRKKGIGTTVNKNTISAKLDNWISFTKEMKNQGIEVVNYMVNNSLVYAEKEIYKALSISKTQKIWKLEKIRGDIDAKYLYSVSYFHPRVGIAKGDSFNAPLYDILEKEYDIIVSNSSEKFKAIKADPQIAAFLDIDEGEAILKRERLVTDVGNKVVEYNIVYYQTENFAYSIDIKREL